MSTVMMTCLCKSFLASCALLAILVDSVMAQTMAQVLQEPIGEGALDKSQNLQMHEAFATIYFSVLCMTCAVPEANCCPDFASVTVDYYGACGGRVAAVPRCLYCPTYAPNKYRLVVISIPAVATSGIFCFVCSRTILWGDGSFYDQIVSTCSYSQEVHTYGGGGTYYLMIYLGYFNETTLCGNPSYANLTVNC